MRIVAPDLTATAVGKRDIRVDTSEFAPATRLPYVCAAVRHGHDTMVGFVHRVHDTGCVRHEAATTLLSLLLTCAPTCLQLDPRGRLVSSGPRASCSPTSPLATVSLFAGPLLILCRALTHFECIWVMVSITGVTA